MVLHHRWNSGVATIANLDLEAVALKHLFQPKQDVRVVLDDENLLFHKSRLKRFTFFPLKLESPRALVASAWRNNCRRLREPHRPHRRRARAQFAGPA